RLHSTKNPFHERRPWGHDAETERVASAAMRLRHAFIPYLYSMAWRNHTQHLPLVQPMYHSYPQDEAAYHCPDQYTFGTELIAAPFITPADADTRLSRQAVWLPAGQWFGFFDGLPFVGDGWQAIYGRLADIPVFAKAGAIVPLAAAGEDGVANPAALDIHLFPGADNAFDLYEDDGLRAHSITAVHHQFSVNEWTATVETAVAETAHLPARRTYSLLFRNAAQGVTVSANQPITTRYDADTRTLWVTAVPITPAESLTVTLAAGENGLVVAGDGRLPTVQRIVSAFRMESWYKHYLYDQLAALVADPQQLADHDLRLTPSQFRALVETLTGAGYHRRAERHSTDEVVILWNNTGNEAVQYSLKAVDADGRAHQQITHAGILPRFAVLTIGAKSLNLHLEQPAPPSQFAPQPWRLQIGYWQLVNTVLSA
ncbi:MAG: hypothetical protein KC415_05880, partial [Anaerolineales bacterium]|nr:hypothetical protein [Anaerolineales bacterium]